MSFLSLFGFKPKPTLPPLRFRNTLGGALEEFKPLGSGVKMYNCGPTVYDRQHIGNMRPYVMADILKRVLAAWGYKVKQVVNITDVGHLVGDEDAGEDKMEASARKSGRKAQDIAKEITELFFNDLSLLGIDRNKIEFPRATAYIPQQISLIKALEEKGYAYRISDGIYFDTQKFQGYGKLGAINLKGLEAGARVEENPEKRNQHDFALWKFSPKGEKRQQEWHSPWGVGFPGWHIECTAMIFELLGKQIDIHTGGVDHIPVHHNNEIAQAEAITKKQYVRYWLHNEHITIEGKKISKSLGNTVYLSQIADRGFSPRSLRYWFLTSHYRTPANFTWEAIEGADQALKRLQKLYLELGTKKDATVSDGTFEEDLYKALADDLNTPKALARVWELAKNDAISPAAKREALTLADKVLGLGLSESRPTLKIIPRQELPQEIQDLVASRETARHQKDFALADQFRAQIEERGFEVKDTSEGPKISQK